MTLRDLITNVLGVCPIEADINGRCPVDAEDGEPISCERCTTDAIIALLKERVEQIETEASKEMWNPFLWQGFKCAIKATLKMLEE